MRWFVVVIGLLILALGGIAAWMAATQPFDPQPRLPDGFQSPILAIELVRSADEARSIFRDPLGCGNRRVVRRQIREDWYFIAAYWATFVGMGLLLARRRAPATWAPAGLVLILATSAAVYDVRENLGILRMVGSTSPALTDAMASATREPSLIKWGLIFTVEALLSLLFLARRAWGRTTRLLGNVAGSLLLASAVVGFYGLTSNAAIGFAVPLMTLGLAAALPLFLAVPSVFLASDGGVA